MVLRGIGHVHDEACMTTVNVILAAEQRGGLVEQGRRNGRKITGQAVDLLVDVRLSALLRPRLNSAPDQNG